MVRFGAGDQSLPFCNSCLSCQDNSTCLTPLSRNFQSLYIMFYKCEILLLMLSVSSVLLDPTLFVCVIRRGLRHRLCCFWNTHMWKLICEKAIDPSPLPTLNVDTAVYEPCKCFRFWYLSGEGEISIPCWSLCFATVWLSIREQSDSPVCHLFLLGGLPEGRKCGDQRHFEQDATVLSFFHSL